MHDHLVAGRVDLGHASLAPVEESDRLVDRREGVGVARRELLSTFPQPGDRGAQGHPSRRGYLVDQFPIVAPESLWATSSSRSSGCTRATRT